MTVREIRRADGFSLIEMVVVIVVLGIVAAIAMQSMTASIDDIRRVETEREMEMLVFAIAGNPALHSGGARCDFGYIGDVGAFPPDLKALYRNPGGYATWDGPYLPPGYVQDTTGFRLDAWGAPYLYSGGTQLTSIGSGSDIAVKVASSADDYLSNTLRGIVRDANDSVPGTIHMDSVDVEITVPNGLGGLSTRYTSPDSSGAFTLTSLPVGTHPVRAIYVPAADTALRYVTVLPRHRSSPPPQFRFSSAYFSSAASPCTQPEILVPSGSGSVTELTASGCIANWQCVDDAVPDENGSYVWSSSTVSALDLYQTGDPVDTNCRIVSVTIHFRARKFVRDSYARAILRIQGTLFEGAEETLTADFSDYNAQWTMNPSTGSAWTWQEITDIEIGVGLRASRWTHPPRCTRVWLEVTRAP